MTIHLPDVGLQADELAGRGGPFAVRQTFRHKNADHIAVLYGHAVGAERSHQLQAVPAPQRQMPVSYTHLSMQGTIGTYQSLRAEQE